MLESESGENGAELIPDPLVGRTLNDRYRIVSPIGVGGMGKVYKAVQMPLERAVALKVLDPAYARSSDPNFLRRFMREASLTAQLRHPNTVTVIDYGQADDIYYIAMEYLEGQTLSKLLARQGPLPWPRALEIAQQICRSVREAHNLGVVHRDLKPANIMVMSEADTDLVKVLDFGLVKSVGPEQEAPRSPEITQHGIFLGSPTYMAPEQAKNHSDLRSDIYSLGIVMYQMLSGRPPFVSQDHIELIFSHHREPPAPFTVARPDVHVPPEVEAVVMKCLNKHPNARFQTMDELLEAMRGAAAAAGLSGTFSTTGTFARPHAGAVPRTNPGLVGQRTPPPPSRAVAADPDGVHIEVDEPTVQGRAVGGRLIPLLVVVGAIFLIGGGAVLNQWLKTPVESAPAAVAAVVPSPAPAPARSFERKRPAVERDSNAVAAPRVAHFSVNSQPEGADVLWKGESMGLTPTTFDVALGKDGTATAEITLQLEGYQTETVTTGGSGDVVLMQRLRKLEPKEARNVVAATAHAPTPLPPAPPAPAAPAAPEAAKAEAAPAEAATPEDEPAAAPVVQTPVVLGTGSINLPAPEPATAVEKNSAGETVLPFGEGMSRPVQIEGKEVEYTREALNAKVEGDMVVRCTITTQGRLEQCQVLKGLPFMNEAVLKALATRLYTPVTFQGRPVAVKYIFAVKVRHPH